MGVSIGSCTLGFPIGTTIATKIFIYVNELTKDLLLTTKLFAHSTSIFCFVKNRLNQDLKVISD